MDSASGVRSVDQGSGVSFMAINVRRPDRAGCMRSCALNWFRSCCV